jgi:hypothetical protein
MTGSHPVTGIPISQERYRTAIFLYAEVKRKTTSTPVHPRNTGIRNRRRTPITQKGTITFNGGKMRDDQINLIFIKIFFVGILGYGLYLTAGTTGVSIMCFTLLTSQALNVKS